MALQPAGPHGLPKRRCTYSNDDHMAINQCTQLARSRRCWVPRTSLLRVAQSRCLAVAARTRSLHPRWPSVGLVILKRTRWPSADQAGSEATALYLPGTLRPLGRLERRGVVIGYPKYPRSAHAAPRPSRVDTSQFTSSSWSEMGHREETKAAQCGYDLPEINRTMGMGSSHV